MSTPKLVEVKSLEEFENYLKYKCCMFNITFYNIRPKLFQDHPISFSKCLELEDYEEDNGRITHASKLTIVLNEVDFSVINDFYEWDSMSIWNMRIFEKAYLPTPFVKAILKLYADKTTLKGLEDEESLLRYMHSKQYINSTYGMAVTDILQINHTYKDGEWVNESPDIKEVFDKYNNSKSRFLFYPWGVWVTSYARKNLFMGIQAVGRDYIYSDTDSMKIRNASKHIEWIESYNRLCDYKLEMACKWHKIDFSMVSPKTIKGDNKTLGYWSFDGHYLRFKTLGAKRYLYEDDNHEMHLTCAGLSKKTINYMLEKSNNDNTKCFNFFKDGMYIPPDKTGKNIHTYIDDEREGYITDYLGNVNYYHELSGVHLEGAEYELSLSKEYLNYLRGLTQYE